MAVSVGRGRTGPQPCGLRAEVSQRGTTVVVELSGELDLAAEAKVRTAMHAAFRRSPQYLVLDLSRLTFIDATGVRVVVQARQQAAAQLVQLIIVPGPEAVHRVLEICELSK